MVTQKFAPHELGDKEQNISKINEAEELLTIQLKYNLKFYRWSISNKDLQDKIFSKLTEKLINFLSNEMSEKEFNKFVGEVLHNNIQINQVTVQPDKLNIFFTESFSIKRKKMDEIVLDSKNCPDCMKLFNLLRNEPKTNEQIEHYKKSINEL